MDAMFSAQDMTNNMSAFSQDETFLMKRKLIDSQLKFVDSQCVEKKVTEAKYMTEFTNTLQEQLTSYQQKVSSLQAENVQLKIELTKCEAKQSELYYRLEQQLDEWLNEKTSIQSRVGDMEEQLQLSVVAIQGVLSTDRSTLQRQSEGFQDKQESNEVSQGIVQTLLEMGEAFLASKIGEEGFRELQTKLVAAKARDCSIIQGLQHKIDELSEMGTMVTRLKDELREEKEKAKEEAEDWTQEMAELRYQLMEMLEHERELRAYVQQASLDRIAELEEQLKQARQETNATLGHIQTSEARAEMRALELWHLKSAFEEVKQKYANLSSQKLEMEEKLAAQLQELQDKTKILETDLVKANDEIACLRAVEEKLAQLENDSTSLQEQNEAKALLLEDGKAVLQHGMREIRHILADFKHEVILFAEEYRRPKNMLQNTIGVDGLPLREINMKTQLQFGGSPTSSEELPVEKKCLVYAGEAKDHGGIDYTTNLREDVEDLHSVFSPFHNEIHYLGNQSSISGAEQEITEKSLDIINRMTNAKLIMEEEETMHCLLTENEQIKSELHASVAVKGGLESLLSDASADHDIVYENIWQGQNVKSFGSLHKKQRLPWTVEEIVEMVESVTGELTNLLKAVHKAPFSSNQSLFSSLELRLQSWRNIPQRALLYTQSGSIGEWADLVVDIVAQACQEIITIQHQLKELEVEIEFNENIQAQHTSLSKDVTYLNEEITKLEAQYAFEITQQEEGMHVLQRKLEAAYHALSESQKKVSEQEETLDSLREKIWKLELEADRSKSVWASEKQMFGSAVREQFDNLQKEKVRRCNEVEKLERRVKELHQRSERNEEELNGLIEIGCIDMNSALAAKLRQLEQNLRDSRNAEAQLQAEQAELASQVVLLQANLVDAHQQLQSENEQHVEILIQYEEERILMEAELQAVRNALLAKQSEIEKVSAGVSTDLRPDQVGIAMAMPRLIEEQKSKQPYIELQGCLFSKEMKMESEKRLGSEFECKDRDLYLSFEEALCKLSAIDIELDSSNKDAEHLQKALHLSQGNLSNSVEQEHLLKGCIEKVNEKLLKQDEILNDQKAKLASEVETKEKLVNHTTFLESEIRALHQQLAECESQLSEMSMTITNLQEALMLQKVSMNQTNQGAELQDEGIAMWKEDYFHLKAKFDNLLDTLASLQLDLGEARNREKEAQKQAKKLGLELSVAKEEVVKSEVRLQRSLKQAQEQADLQRYQAEIALNAQKQSNWLLTEQLEQLESIQVEKVEFQRALDNLNISLKQAEQERDDLKIAYGELENQFAKRRTVFGK